MGWLDVPTSVDNKMMKYIHNESVYDLQGRRVGDARKGVYIQNGRKVIIR